MPWCGVNGIVAVALAFATLTVLKAADGVRGQTVAPV